MSWFYWFSHQNGTIEIFVRALITFICEMKIENQIKAELPKITFSWWNIRIGYKSSRFCRVWSERNIKRLIMIDCDDSFSWSEYFDGEFLIIKSGSFYSRSFLGGFSMNSAERSCKKVWEYDSKRSLSINQLVQEIIELKQIRSRNDFYRCRI